MRSSIFLSPFLRPVRQQGALAFDNGITESLERLSPLQEEVVRALWHPMAGPTRMRDLYSQYGQQAVDDVLDDLERLHMVFPSRDECITLFHRFLETSTAELPFVDQVELTNICPMHCRFCPRGVPGRMTRPKGYMDFALFERLIAQVNPRQGRYRMMELHHLGESLLHPELARFVEHATSRGIPTELSANPSLLDPARAQALLDAGIRRMVLSLDGMDDATLGAIRGPVANYSRAERNIEALLHQLAGHPEPATVVVQMIALHRNEGQRDQFLERWGQRDLPYFKAYVKALDGPDPDSGVERPCPTRYLCTYPWRSVVVLWDGRVVPCCLDDDARYVIGNLNEKSLGDIWTGQKASDLRVMHLSLGMPEGHLCGSCSWRWDKFAGAMHERHPDKAVQNPLQW